MLRDRVEGSGERRLTADLSRLVTKGNPAAVLSNPHALDTWNSYLRGDARYWDALMAMTIVAVDATTSAGTNKNECWHAALKTKRSLLSVKNFNTLLSGLDMSARQYNVARGAGYYPASTTVVEHASEVALPSRRGRRRDPTIVHRPKRPRLSSQAAMEVTHMRSALFCCLHGRPMQEGNDLFDFQYPRTSLRDLQSRGFAVKLAASKKLTDEERDTIETALITLDTPAGAAVMGNYNNVANWIAQVHLGGSRTGPRVASYLGGLVAEMHKTAHQEGLPEYPVPEDLEGLTLMVDRSGVAEECDEGSRQEDGCVSDSDDTERAVCLADSEVSDLTSESSQSDE